MADEFKPKKSFVTSLTRSSKVYRRNGEGCWIIVHHSGTDTHGSCFRANTNDDDSWKIIDSSLKFRDNFEQACEDLDELAQQQGWVER